MKISELIAYFGEKTVLEQPMNPLAIAEQCEFDKKEPRTIAGGDKRPDYRERAINLVTKLKWWFSSTCNSHYDLMKRYVRVQCPYCTSTETEVYAGSGSGWTHTVTYKCLKCDSRILLTMGYGGFTANPGDKKEE